MANSKRASQRKTQTSAKPRAARKPRLKKAPPPAAASNQDLLRHYRDMLLIRRFEEKAGQL